MAVLHVYLVLYAFLFWSAEHDVSGEIHVVIVAPQQIRFNQSTPVFCSANGVRGGGSDVILELIDGDNQSPIAKHTLSFKTDGVKNVSFTLSPDDVRPTSSYLTLVAKGPASRSEEIKIQRDTGYILIQTDKPVYSPRQTVKYRVIALDEEQRWAPWLVQVEVISPNGIIVDQLQHLDSQSAFSMKEYHLHEHCMLGTWRIEATFKEEVQLLTRSLATFEVKEYVLPKFSVKMSVNPNVITMATREIEINMTAEYVFGNTTEGEADILIGIKNGEKVQRLRKLYHAKFVSGKAVISINTSDLSMLPGWFPKTVARLYVEANVTDYGYGQLQTVSNYIVPISKSIYVFTMDHNQKYFLPRKPFILKGRLTTSTGNAAPRVTVKVIGKSYTTDETLVTESRKTNKDGEFQVKVTLGEVSSVRFHLETVDKRHQTQASHLHVVHSLPKSHILLQADQTETEIRINIGYLSTDTDSHMTIIVESRGKVVYMQSFPMVGSDMRTLILPGSFHKELSPQANVLAFYSRQRGIKAESTLMMSTMTIDVPDVCLEELSLRKIGRAGIQRPGDGVKLWLEGTKNTKVGLVAVDKSVYLLSGEKTISRSSLFDYLGSHNSEPGHRKSGKQTWTANGFTLSVLEQPVLIYPHFPVGIKGQSGGGLPGLPGFGGGLPGPNFVTTGGKGMKTGTDYTDGNGNLPEVESDFDIFDIPPRVYFPETWLFEDHLLTRRGRRRKSNNVRIRLSYKLPDSVSTWTFQAVGVSSGRGVCVSKTLDVIVNMPFFVDLLLPYKAVRLESVKIKVPIFNNLQRSVKVILRITVPEELCLVQTKARIRRGHRRITYKRILLPNERKWVEYEVIPLKAGQFNISVKASGNRISDSISKAIYVVPEGRLVSKTVTFQLDPSALMLNNFTDMEGNVADSRQGETIKTTWNRMRSEQTTVVDMALPSDTIPGTSRSNIYAYGDLLGDVVNSVFLESESLMLDSESEGRRVLGDLAPAVYTLQYLQTMGLLVNDLQDRGTQFVKQGVTQLLTYRNSDGSFSYYAGKPPSTWYTAAVLQTLCVVKDSALTFVDEKLIEDGAIWLLSQIGEEGELNETDVRRKGLAEREASVLLASETLLCILQCENHLAEGEGQDMLKIQLWTYLEDNLENISSSLVLAKVSLALHLVDSEFTDVAVKNLINSKRNTSDGVFWSDRDPDVRKFKSALHTAPVDAQSVEATSFALMTLLETRRLNDVRSVVTWLVQQRGKHGAFVGAMDTAAATQALAMYSVRRQSVESDLHCNITSYQSDSYLETVDFSQQEAIVKKGVSGVPTGEIYQFDSSGSRLGQMQIETEYNIAVGKNDHCPFNITIQSKPFIRRSTFYGAKLSPLCDHCNFGCSDDEDNSDKSGRHARSVVGHSANIFCLQICLSPIGNQTFYNVRVDTGLLSGYEGLAVTDSEMHEMTKGRATVHRYKKGIFTVELNEVPGGETTCFGLHAKDNDEVKYQQPAVVTVKEEDKREPSCSMTYDVSDVSVTLPVYCSSSSKRRKGVCMCTSGACGKCHPLNRPIGSRHIREMLCDVDFVYKVKTDGEEKDGAWNHLATEVLSTPIPGRERIVPGQSLQFSSPSYCISCPNIYKDRRNLYVMGRNAERLMDWDGTEIFRHVVDDSVAFIRVTTDRTVSKKHATRENYVTRAIREGCRNPK